MRYFEKVGEVKLLYALLTEDVAEWDKSFYLEPKLDADSVSFLADEG